MDAYLISRFEMLSSAALALCLTLITLDVTAAAPAPGPSPQEQWKAECASCHIAYPAKRLPASAWRRLMSGLDRHFGTDASVDAAAATAITAYLEQHAGRDRRGDTQTLRITETSWFLREHDEVPPALWKSPAVNSAANCAACHTQAESGDFRERNIRLPR
jgi:hypothetical protein